MSLPTNLDALVIGAGPAGIGTALALGAVSNLTYGVLERGKIGESFREWPKARTFLTPSFTSNGYGAVDLNAIHPATSPAYTLGTDYPTGSEYGKYLCSVASFFEIPTLEDTTVTDVHPGEKSFLVDTSRGKLTTQFLVWAGGEYAEPIAPKIPGAEFTTHVRTPQAWKIHPGKRVVIGGYESGIEVACHHAQQGADVTVVDAEGYWKPKPGSDPSFSLSPRTRTWLKKVLATGKLTLIAADAISVEKNDSNYTVRLNNGSRLTSNTPPISATGYACGLGPVRNLFTTRDDGWPLIDDDDQSTMTPGLFLSGPSVRHDGQKFCFIYKFRQRFAHIADCIGTSIGKDTSKLKAWRTAGMAIDDLTCCGGNCAC